MAETISGRGARAGRGPVGMAIFAAGRLGGALAALVGLVSGLVAALIVLGVAFSVLKANPHNGIVTNVHDAARFFVGPFDRIFMPKDHRLALAIDWGLAAIVYVILGRLVARLLASLDRRA